MTTAHRPTWAPAKVGRSAVGGGQVGGARQPLAGARQPRALLRARLRLPGLQTPP